LLANLSYYRSASPAQKLGKGAELEFIVLVLMALGMFFLPFIFSVVAMASCQSLKKRVERLEASLERLVAVHQVGNDDQDKFGNAPATTSSVTNSVKESHRAALSLAKEKTSPAEPTTVTSSPTTGSVSANVSMHKAWPDSPKTAAPKSKIAASQAGAENSLEQFFLGSLFNKLGALAIIVFVILFIKWLSPFLALTAAMKVGAVYIFSSVLVGLGFYLLPKENMRGFSETLLGLGLASAIMITYAGSVYFDLWDNYVSLALASLILLGTYVLAYWAKRRSVICLGALAGYANLIFIQTSIDSTYVFDVYLVILALFCLVGTVRCQKWNSLFSINLAITWLFIATRTGIFEKADRIFSPYALGAIWLIVLVYDYFRRQDESDPKQPSVWINHLMMALGANCIYSEGQAFGAFMMASAALFCLAKLRAENMNTLARAFVNAGLFVVGLSAYSFQEPLTRVAFLSAAGLIILWIAFNKVAKPEVQRRLFFWSGLHNVLAFFMMLVADFNGKFDFFLTPNRELHKLAIVIFGVSIAAWLLGYLMFRHYNGDAKYRDFNLWAGITLAYIYFGRELADILDRVLNLNGQQWWAFSCFSLVAVCSIYALQAMLQAKKAKSNAFAIGFNLALALSLFGLTINILSCVTGAYAEFIPIVNIGFLAHILTILALAAAFVLYGSDIYIVGAVLAGWSLVHIEGHNIAAVCHLDSITSVLWMLYAAAILWGGIRFKNRYVTNCGIFIVCITLLRVITYDIVKLPIGYKLLLFFVLGVALLVTSYYYSKRLGNNGSDKLAAIDGADPEPSSVTSFTNSPVASSKDTQELKEIEIPDLTEQNAFKKVDDIASQSPFSDRLNQADNTENASAVITETENETDLGVSPVTESAKNPLTVARASWHND